MSWQPNDSNPQRRKFRDRWQINDEGYGAADAEDHYDNGNANDLSFEEHVAGFERDPQYDANTNTYQPQWQPYSSTPPDYSSQPPTGYPPQVAYPPQPPMGYPPQPPTGYPPQAAYPPQPPMGYPPPPAYPPQPQPPMGYPPQVPTGYPPQVAYPPQPQPPTGYPPQAAYPTAAVPLPESAQRLQDRLKKLPQTGRLEEAVQPRKSKDGIDSLFDAKPNLPCASPVFIGLFVMLTLGLLFAMSILALGSLDRHLGLGIF